MTKRLFENALGALYNYTLDLPVEHWTVSFWN